MEQSQYPLVTFALFAYNQEKYIREAVEAALAQDYPNLEVIVSDDASVDGTWAVIQGIAEDYKGPHNLIVARNECNLGPFRHVLKVGGKASGVLVVMAAADDLSKPERVSRMQRAWRETGAWGLSSRYDVIDAEGRVLARKARTEELFSPGFDLRNYFVHADAINIVHGATSAYSKAVFNLANYENAPDILAEDGMLSLMINFLGKPIVNLEESLIQYRMHDGALTNTGSPPLNTSESIVRFIDKSKRYAASSRERAKFLLQFAQAYPGETTRKLNMSYILRDIRRQDLRARWDEIGSLGRLRELWQCPTDWRWILPRVLGRNIYVASKRWRK